MLCPSNILLRRVYLLAFGSLVSSCSCASDSGAPARTGSTGSTGDAATTELTTGTEYVCVPGETRCAGERFLETCAPTGREWLMDSCPTNSVCKACDSDNETCSADHCLGPCDVAPDIPSSAGCSFIANRQLHPAEEWDDGIVVGNPHDNLTATISIFKIPEGRRKEELVDGFPITLEPRDAFSYRIKTSFIAGLTSRFRTGGMFRIASDVPIIAYQHSPLENNQFNDSSLLLPESVLGHDYIVASYPPVANSNLTTGSGRPSYFEVIATEDLTTVEWTPPVATHGDGLPIKPVQPGETGSMRMNRFDTMRITASNADTPLLSRDLSGTVIHSDKPIWVVGATRCTGAPIPESFQGASCDNVQELLIPLQHWGRRYVAPAAPPRGEEWTHWRIYAGRDDVTVTSTPTYNGSEWTSASLPHTFAQRGDYIDISVPSQEHLVLEGDGPFMPVLHLQSKRVRLLEQETGFPPGTGDIPGDTSMVQMVPTEQYLSRYVFMTGIGYRDIWAIIIKQSGKGDIFVDGTLVENFAPIGQYEVAHFALQNRLADDTDVHVAESTDPFGLIQVGYSRDQCADEEGADGCVNQGSFQDACTPPHGRCNSSYAFSGGMKAEVIYVP